MRDGSSAAGKYVTVILFWLIPVALIIIPVVYPTEGYVREILVLPVIFLLLYVAVLLAPLFRPLRNIDFFDDVPETIERYVEARRARNEARDLIRLYDGGKLPNVYELASLTPFQKNVKHIADGLRIDAEWHASNAEVSHDLLERMETLMRATGEEEAEREPSRAPRKKGGKHR
jgi:hypothetical protein